MRIPIFAAALAALLAAPGCTGRFVSDRMSESRPHLATLQEVVSNALDEALKDVKFSSHGIDVPGKAVAVEVSGTFFGEDTALREMVRHTVELALLKEGAKIRPPAGYVRSADGTLELKAGAPPDLTVIVMCRQAGGNLGNTDFIIYQSRWVEAVANLRMAAYGPQGMVGRVVETQGDDFHRLAMQLLYLIKLPTKHYGTEGFFNLYDFATGLVGI